MFSDISKTVWNGSTPFAYKGAVPFMYNGSFRVFIGAVPRCFGYNRTTK